MSNQPLTLRWLAFILTGFTLVSACRLADIIVQASSYVPTPVANVRHKSRTPTAAELQALSVTQPRPGPQLLSELPTETEWPTETGWPTETDWPTETPEPAQSYQVQPASRPFVFRTDTPEPTETPLPTREFKYLVSHSDCRPNIQTFVEGTVTDQGEPVDGLLVRISTNMGGDPAWTDYVTGADDTKPGGYTQIIAAGRPLGGLWYLWLVDPDNKNRVSDIATVKTDSIRREDNGTDPGSCQSAVVDFSTPDYTDNSGSEDYPTDTPEPSVTATRTGTPPTATRTPTATRRPTKTPTP